MQTSFSGSREKNGIHTKLKRQAHIGNCIYFLPDFPRWRDLLVTTASSYLPTVPATASGINRPGTTSAAANAEEDCVDVHDNCHGFGRDVCSDYEQWARAHCAATCRFCSRNGERCCNVNLVC